MQTTPVRPDVLDFAQLTRIESVHRGFFYQHLYAVACLLVAESARVRAVFTETDEDLELLTDEVRWYVQVKTRLTSLQPSDVAETLVRFDALREQHKSGDRSGAAKFAIVTNVKSSPELTRRLSTWAEDITLLTPASTGSLPPLLPQPQVDLSTALARIGEMAAKVPLSRLEGATLVLKLAALVQFASSGMPPYQDHRFAVEDLPSLFEQIAVQLQDFPPIDPAYEPQQDEPPLVTPQPIRIITGISGAGKSAWAAQAAVDEAGGVLYFDVGDSAPGNVTASLAREFAAKLAGRDIDVRAALLPGASALDALRTLSAIANHAQAAVTIYLDNAHRVGLDEVRTILTALPGQRMILLAQPSSEINALVALLNISEEKLQGWSLPSIARVFARRGVAIDIPTSEQLRGVTGAIPLYVRQAAELTKTRFDGDAALFCAALSSGTHTLTTAQEAILRQTIATLQTETLGVIAAASVADVPFQIDELIGLASVLNIDRASALRGVREASDRGMLLATSDQRIQLHDAFRVIARDLLDAYGTDTIQRILSELLERLMASLSEHRDVRRIPLLMRTLAALGKTDVLVDAITTEFFHEFGFSAELEGLVARVLKDPNVSGSDRFWALDALAFWRLQGGEVDDAEKFIHEMAAQTDIVTSSQSARSALLTKQMLVAARRGKRKECQRLFKDALGGVGEDIDVLRIVRYNYAVACRMLGRHEETAKYSEALSAEYLESLGVTWEDIIGKNPPEIASRLAPIDSSRQDRIKHLADSLDLYGRTSRRGAVATLLRIAAVKLYTVAQAPTSVVRVGMDVVADLLETTDHPTAREFTELVLLPTIREFGLLSHVLAARAQYAVVLAYCGDIDAAANELDNIRPFVNALSSVALAEFQNQERLIERIAAERALPTASV